MPFLFSLLCCVLLFICLSSQVYPYLQCILLFFMYLFTVCGIRTRLCCDMTFLELCNTCIIPQRKIVHKSQTYAVQIQLFILQSYAFHSELLFRTNTKLFSPKIYCIWRCSPPKQRRPLAFDIREKNRKSPYQNNKKDK